MKRIICLAVLCVTLTACNQPPEVIARDSIAGAKAALDSAKAKHPECAGSTAGLCGLLSKATGAKDVAIDSLEIWCSGPSFNSGGACNPPQKGTSAYQQGLDKVTAAIANMNQAVTDVKKATGN